MRELLLETRTLAWRAFVHSKRTPMVLAAGLIQPLIWLFLFSAVFKNSPMRDLAAGSYLAFITPGALVFTAFTGALNGGVPILFDRELGLLDRLLGAPLRSRLSIFWANGWHIFVMSLLQCAVIMVLTALMGGRFQGGPAGMLVLVAALGLVSILFTTLRLTLAFMLRRHFELISIVMIISLPMAFISTAFAPVTYMPAWLKALVSVNPVTLTVEPLRAGFFDASWSWTATIYDSPLASYSLVTCLLLLVFLNLLMSQFAWSVIRKKLG